MVDTPLPPHPMPRPPLERPRIAATRSRWWRELFRSERSPDFGGNREGIEGLRQARDRTDFQGPRDLVSLGLRGEEHNGYIGGSFVGFEPPACLISVETGHHAVQQNGVEPRFLGSCQRILAGFDDLDLEVRIEPERELENRADIGFVVGAEGAHGSTEARE